MLSQLLKRVSFLSVPPRKIVLLPDALFFCRTVEVGENATPADVAAQVELALEAMAPFPVAQLYHGHYWRAGAKHAFAYAAYRKRIPAEQSDTWGDAEGVLPAFATVLGTALERPTTIVIASDEAVTAVHWNDPADVPAEVTTRALPPGASDEERAALRKEILEGYYDGRAVVELAAPAELVASDDSSEFVFQSGKTDTTFTREQLDMADVRDKEELASRRNERRRDLLLWRAFAGCAIAIALAFVFEIALIGGKLWQRSRVSKFEEQAPVVAKITTAQNLVTRINELSTKRLRPFEMISLASEKKPASVVFLSTTITGLHTLEVEAQTSTSTDVDVYRSALTNTPDCERVEIQDLRSRDGTSTFRLVVTFKDAAFTQEASS